VKIILLVTILKKYADPGSDHNFLYKREIGDSKLDVSKYNEALGVLLKSMTSDMHRN
jgi:hypothetical protein